VLICLASSGVFPAKPKARTLPVKNQKQKKDPNALQTTEFINLKFFKFLEFVKFFTFG
tara:strand:- start:134 stop:307 length:174 start_codon:yes stop_codon:yes gene_type:complete